MTSHSAILQRAAKMLVEFIGLILNKSPLRGSLSFKLFLWSSLVYNCKEKKTGNEFEQKGHRNNQ